MKNKKDVLVLCQFFYPEYISSATLPYEMSIDLIKDNFSVDVLCGYPKEYSTEKKISKQETIEGIHIKRVKYLQLSRKSKIGRIINYFSFICSIGLKFFSLRRYKSIIVYSNPPILPMISILANKFFGTEIIYVCYDIYPELGLLLGGIKAGSVIEKVMNYINHSLFKYASQVVALSEEMKQYLLKSKEEIDLNRISVIPNWYDAVQENKKIQSDTFLKLRSDYKTIIVYAGNMGICQDMETIFNAIIQLREQEKILFCLAGHGSKQNDLKQRAEKEKLSQVVFFDFLTGSDFTDLLKIADCLIVSLEKGVEGLSVPSKTYSYLAMGKPVIAIMDKNTDIAQDIEKTNSGFCEDQGAVENLINDIFIIDQNKSLVKKMGKNSRELFLKKYTRQICTRQYASLLKKVIDKRS